MWIDYPFRNEDSLAQDEHWLPHRREVKRLKVALRSIVIAFTLLPLLSSPAQQSSTPSIWFSPLDPAPRQFSNFSGSKQFMDLFSPSAAWTGAASHINVFKLTPNWVTSASKTVPSATDAQLKTQFQDLHRRGIILALEYGPITRSQDCSKGIMGESAGGEGLLAAVRRINNDGGDLRYVSMDEPAFFSVMKNRCHWDPEHAAANAATNAKAVLAEFPNIKFGEIEPIGAAGQAGMSIPQIMSIYQRFITAFEKDMGSPLAYFHADVVWDSPSFPSNLIALRDLISKNGISFGVIYNGSAKDQSNKAWIEAAKRHIDEVEKTIGTPETIVFQSWDPYPDKLLPEQDSDSFTWLIDQYAQKKGLPAVANRNTNRVEEANAASTQRPGSELGAPRVYGLDGQIPAATRRVAFGIRVNTECNCSGNADFQVTNFNFRSDHGVEVNYGFESQGDLDKWHTSIPLNSVHGLTGLAGGGQIDIANNALRVVAQPGQKVALNGTPFSVSGGGTYHLEVTASIPPESSGSGNFVLMFLGDGGEISRAVIPIRSAAAAR